MSLFWKRRITDDKKVVHISVTTDYSGRPPKEIKEDFDGFDIFLKPTAFDIIKAAKDCRTDQDVANILGYTRRYILALKAQKKPATGDVIKRIAVVMGSLNDRWWVFYEFKKVIPKNSKKNNYAKFNGDVPYSHLSSAGQSRKMDDSGVEIDQKNT